MLRVGCATYQNGKLFGTTYSFYARGVGLVREEMYVGRKLFGIGSRELSNWILGEHPKGRLGSLGGGVESRKKKSSTLDGHLGGLIGTGSDKRGVGGLGLRGGGGGSTALGVGGEETLVVGYDKQVANGVIGRHLNQIQLCHRRALLEDPKISGKVIVNFHVGTDGTVPMARIKESTLAGPAKKHMLECVVARFRAFQFPPATGGIGIVNYPLLFKSGS